MSPKTTLSMLRSAVDGFVVAVEAMLEAKEGRRAEPEGIVCQGSPFRNSDTQIVFGGNFFSTWLWDAFVAIADPRPRLRCGGIMGGMCP